ncbi:ORFS364W.iORF3 [Human betaherpesvirus 5]|nr:ORFS364W.iORF3 [Human betaherpesvirus 5]QHX40736.1 ORFS364W.iORF3 [Human betaherpesvirus 5]
MFTLSTSRPPICFSFVHYLCGCNTS